MKTHLSLCLSLGGAKQDIEAATHSSAAFLCLWTFELRPRRQVVKKRFSVAGNFELYVISAIGILGCYIFKLTRRRECSIM